MLTSSRKAGAWSAAIALFSIGRPAQAEDPEARPPIPEPILNETTTDVDGTDPGEVEIEANTSVLRSRVDHAYDIELSAEIEVLLTRHIGAKVEPSFEREALVGESPGESAAFAGSLSWKLVQDFKHDFHLQAEVAGRVPADASNVVQPGESPLPLSLDLFSGLRRGPITFRNSLGMSAATDPRRVGVHGSVAVLTGFDLTERFGFWGIEADADGARANPVLVALDLVPDLAAIGLPFALGFVLPYSVGADGRAPSYGFYVRLFVESAREREYVSAGRSQ